MTSDHKPECVLSEACEANEPLHAYCDCVMQLHCMHCEQYCDCSRIERAEQRVRLELEGTL